MNEKKYKNAAARAAYNAGVEDGVRRERERTLQTRGARIEASLLTAPEIDTAHWPRETECPAQALDNSANTAAA